MARRGSLVLWLALTGTFALPGAAHALSCPQTSVLYEEQRAELILVAEALPGDTAPDGTLLSPADFRVLRYEKGTGPVELKVRTGTSRTTLPDGSPGYVGVGGGWGPRAGVTYRILGVRAANEEIDPTSCPGPPVVAPRPPRFNVRVGQGPPRRLPASDVNGRRASRPLPHIVAAPGGVITLGPGSVGSGEIAVTRAGAYTAFGTRSRNGWRLPRRLKARSRLVVHTGRALYAFTLVRAR